MLNRANKRFKTLTSGASADGRRVEPGEFDPILGDGEGVHHVCSSTDGFEHETENRTTTMEPGSGADAHVVVTDRRVLGVLGTGDADPAFALDAVDVTQAKSRDGLLSSTLVVATADETIRFTPDDGTDVGRVADTVDRVANAWGDLESALAGVERAISEYDDRVANGMDPDAAMTNVRSRLSQAHHCATKDEYTPNDEMLAELEPLEERIEGLRVTGRLDRVESLLEDAAERRADEPAAAVEAVVSADRQLDDAREVHGEVGSTAVSQRITELTERVDALGESLLADARECCTVAAEADDPATAVDRWETALGRYRTIIDAGWDGPAGVSSEAIRFQLAWVVGNRVDALRARADELEAEGDEFDDADAYEDAIATHESANDILAECPFDAGPTGDDAIDRLEEKVAQAEWQWGEA